MTDGSRSHNLQRKIVAAIVLAGLLPLGLSLVVTYLEERRALREVIGVNFKELSVEIARRVEMHVTRSLNEAQQLATVPFVRTAVGEANRSYEGKSDAQAQAMIKDWQQRWKSREKGNEFPIFINRIVTNYLIRWHDIRKVDYLGILVTDQRGAMVVSSIPQVEYDYGGAAWWQALKNDGGRHVFVGDLAFDPTYGTHVLHVAVPILDDVRKEFVGAVTVLLRRDGLFHAISDTVVGTTGHAMLMGGDGVPLICPVLALEEHQVGPDLVRALASGQAGWTESENDSHGGRHGLVGFAPVRFSEELVPGSLGGRTWVAFVRQDPEETYAPLNKLLGKVALYGLGVFGVLLGTGVLMARRITKPIHTLQEGVHKIGGGHLDHRVELKTGDEIEDLATAFNAMAENLRRSFGELEGRMGEIRRLQERYRDLIENAPEMIHQVDKAGRFVHVNATELNKLGYTLEDMLQMHVWEIVPKGRGAEILTHLERLVATGRSAIETQFITKSGQAIDVEMHTTGLFDQEGGGLVYSRSFVRDVTERRRLEQQIQRYTLQLEQEVASRTQELSSSQARYKALFDLVADAVFMVDHAGTVVAVNKREEQVLGYPEGEVVGRRILDLVPTQYHEDLVYRIGKIVQGERRVPTQEMVILSRVGRDVHAEIDLIRVDTGDRPSVMVQVRDITDRKRLERALQMHRDDLEEKVRERTREIEETKQYLENLLENANDVIYTLDVEQRFTYVNGKVEAWGYRKEDLLGRPYLALLSRRHRGRRLKSTLDIGAKQVYEVEVVSKTGEPRSVMVSVSPLCDAEGRITGVLGIARDMTDMKRFEQYIRSSEKLASVGKLAAGVAHEINNPLGGILNCLYNIRKGLLSPARQEEYLAAIEDGLLRVQKIVRQLLDFSQQHQPELAPTEINSVVERVLVLTNHIFVGNQITLDVQYGRDLPPVMVDRHMIEQVLMNLVLNAVQAIRHNGKVTIGTKVVEGVCTIHVRDTGSGIAPQVLPKIFDPFFTTKGTGEGTGLGLSVSLGIVERHGGRILVDSEVGKGSTFTLCLPLVREPYSIENAS